MLTDPILSPVPQLVVSNETALRRSVAKQSVRFTGKTPPRNFNWHVGSYVIARQGTMVHVRWSLARSGERVAITESRVNTAKNADRKIGVGCKFDPMGEVTSECAARALIRWSPGGRVRRGRGVRRSISD